MKPPEKRRKIYECLKSRFRSGEFYPGSRLPKETELAMEYSVALETMRSVLKLLEDEQLIDRIKGKGTFASKPMISRRPSITYLLPCPGFMHWNDLSSSILREILFGCMEAAFKLDLNIESVPISPTNNADDIDWTKLEHLNADSRVVLPGWWFKKIFPLLHERKCRVAGFLPSYNNPGYSHITDSWLVLELCEAKACEDALRHLLQCGCREIALAAGYLSERNNPYQEVYERVITRIPSRGQSILYDIPLNASLGSLRRDLSHLWRQTKFDGMFLGEYQTSNTQWSLNRNLGLPESVKIITAYDSENNLKLSPQVSALGRPYRQIGFDAVTALTQNAFTPGRSVLDVTLLARESTLGQDCAHDEISCTVN